jgi:hypothetical protein
MPSRSYLYADPERAIDGWCADALQRMAGNISWTTDLGMPFSRNRDVMDAVHAMRAKGPRQWSFEDQSATGRGNEDG